MPGTTFQGPGTRKMGGAGDTPYIVVAFLHWEVGPRSGGLNSVLVVFAAVVLLFTGRYPVSIFELVMGFTGGPIESLHTRASCAMSIRPSSLALSRVG